MFIKKELESSTRLYEGVLYDLEISIGLDVHLMLAEI
jgi:hypothetical protein